MKENPDSRRNYLTESHISCEPQLIGSMNENLGTFEGVKDVKLDCHLIVLLAMLPSLSVDS